MDEFGFDTIDAEYRRLGLKHGWTFMATPQERLRTARVAFVGLNPGGGGPDDTHQYEGVWHSPKGNAYFCERWGPNQTETAIQRQVWAWHAALGLRPDDSLCAQFVPFRSPDWHRLDRKQEAIDFARRLWRWTLLASPAALFITMGKLPGELLAELAGAKPIARLPTGWGQQSIQVWKTSDNRRIVGMPHPSRYTLFGRRGAASDIAEASFRVATDSTREA